MVAALFDKEVVNHEILVLTGRQGIYKTTWLNNLLSPELRRYFYLKSNARRITKDDLLTLAEFAIAMPAASSPTIAVSRSCRCLV